MLSWCHHILDKSPDSVSSFMQRQLTLMLSVAVYSTTKTLMWYKLIGESFSPLHRATMLVNHSLVCICGLLHGWPAFNKIPFRSCLDLALDIKNVPATWLVDTCFIAGSRAAETLNYSFLFPCFIAHYNCNLSPISLFHCCKDWCLLMQWLVRAHFYWQLERSLCLGESNYNFSWILHLFSRKMGVWPECTICN